MPEGFYVGDTDAVRRVPSQQVDELGLACAQALSQATPVVKDAADTVAPYVKAGLQTASDVALPALKAAEPVVQARGTRSLILEAEVAVNTSQQKSELPCTHANMLSSCKLPSEAVSGNGATLSVR